MRHYGTVSLELSLKPFGLDRFDPAAAERTAGELFRQWGALLRHAAAVQVMLWIGDGSEILTYAGDEAAEFEWGKWIGGANCQPKLANDPKGEALHARCYEYMPDPPRLTYRRLRELVAAIRRAGAHLGIPVRVGTTFDPGPEFAKSAFKYAWHPEILMGKTMMGATVGSPTFVCCYSTLDADTRRYAGFPTGIPQGLPFGTFLGRQSRHFLADMGLDYLWLSNGFGFGMETWGVRGAVFDGERFRAERRHECGAKVLAFWKALRAELPNVPLETRGTNLMTGTDIGGDGQPLREIYRGGFGIQAPPNSPWAALDSDFGLELAGWMSHVAELPPDNPAFLFRFYTHDPWWLNSPWLDRYGHEAHDIFLPGAVARLDGEGAVRIPDRINFLTADDSLGQMPQQVPDEVIPHLLECRRSAPDAVAPLLWAYPFDEHHDRAFGAQGDMETGWAGDWHVRGAINEGLPLNTVVSTANLRRILARDPQALAGTILVAQVPCAGEPMEAVLQAWSAGGGRCLLYGSTARASTAMRALIGVAPAEPLSGEARVELAMADDGCAEAMPQTVLHRALLNAGGCAETAADARELAAYVFAGGRRVVATRKGAIAWVRGGNGTEYHHGHHPTPDRLDERWPAERLMRLVLAEFGWSLRVERRSVLAAGRPGVHGCGRPGSGPNLTVHRSGNGFWFAGLGRSANDVLRLRTPDGAPLLLGVETWLAGGHATYHLPRAWRRECRVFVDQPGEGEAVCNEITHEKFGATRRLWVAGLRDATVTIYPEAGRTCEVLCDPSWPYLVGKPLDLSVLDGGRRIVCRHVSAPLCLTW